MRKPFLRLLLLLGVLACEKQTDITPAGAPPDLVVVDGMVTNEQKSHCVKLTRTMGRPDAIPTPVTGAVVMVYDADSTWFFTELPAASGCYWSPVTMWPVVGKTYSLLVNTAGKSLTAKAVLSRPLEFLRLRYAATNDGLYKISFVANPFNPNRPAMYKIVLDWSFLPAYREANPDDCRKEVYYYSLPTLDVSEILAPAAEEIRFPAGTRVVQTRFSLSDEQAAFYRALLLNTTWNGGLFNSAPASLPTNLSEGGAGFFGACGVTVKTFFVLPITNEKYF